MARAAAVCFDVGGTLLHMDPPPEVIFADLCRAAGLEVTPPAAAAAYRRAEPWFGAHSGLYVTSPAQFWFEGNRVLLEALGVTEDLDRRAAFITAGFGNRQTGWRIYPEVPETLAALRRRELRLAVVSNWDPGLEHLLERLGLHAAFRVVVGSADVGVAKPDPRIFRLATDALGVAPEQTLHVGDLYDYDIVGARAAGLIPVLVERRAERGSVFPGAPASYDGLRISDLRGLIPLIEGNLEVVGAAT